MILALDQFTQRIDALRTQLKEVGEGLHIDDMERELQELHEEMNADGFWDNLERSTHVNRRISSLEGKIKHYNSLVSGCDDVDTMMELAQEENDESMVEEISAELERLEKETEALALETLMRGPYDDNDAVLSLHAGAGGTEAQDWTSMLYRMRTTTTTPCCPSTPAQAAPRPRTGLRCYTVCIQGTVSAWALP